MVVYVGGTLPFKHRAGIGNGSVEIGRNRPMVNIPRPVGKARTR